MRRHARATDCRVLGVVWQVPIAHGIENQPCAPHVGWLVALFAAHSLGGHELHGVTTLDVVPSCAFPEYLAGAEVGQHSSGYRCWEAGRRRGILAAEFVHMQEDIRRLQVPVQNAPAVEVPEAPADVQEKKPNKFLREHRRIGRIVGNATNEPLGPDEAFQRPRVAIFHQDEQERNVGAHLRMAADLEPRMLVVDDVHMPQSFQRLHLAHHLPQSLCVVT
mmetsp:Transcript_93078/g.262826  ORF Transcript_93078/g.262826 Transcript_93078/m.262826 type:complete len:220 (-) Transcript_93078:1021-1680(-)